MLLDNDLRRSDPGIAIDEEGVWRYGGMEMSRRDIVRLFYLHLQREESGRYFIKIRNQHCPVEVEDTAYVVRSAYHTGDCICLLLSDDSIEALDPATLRIGDNNIPYCRVKDGCFDARFSRSGYYQLAEHIRHFPERDEYYISVKGQLYPVQEKISG